MQKSNSCSQSANGGRWGITKKMLIAMHFSAVLLVTLSLHVTAKTVSQTITFSGRDLPVTQVFEAIKKQTSYAVFYNKELLKGANPVSIAVRNMPLEDFLSEALKNQPFEFFIENRNIIITRKSPTSNYESQTIATRSGLIIINGKVVDEEGRPLAGASVNLKGTNRGVTTDALGNFKIEVPGQGAILVVSFVGYDSQEVSVATEMTINIVLKLSEAKIDEVMIVGYGTTSRRKLTSAVTQVSGEGLLTYPFPSSIEALTGRARGVITMAQGGVPGSLPKVSIRGGGEPLYVIDGLVSSKEEFAGISPNDIENISILKDAAATAVYGSRAGNGIVMITTKRGAIGRVKVTYTGAKSFSQPTTPMRFLAVQQLAEAYDRAGFYNGGNVQSMSVDQHGNLYWKPERLDSLKKGILSKFQGNTDWNALMMEKFAPSQMHDITASGGVKSTRYYMSARMAEQNGIFKNDVSYSRRYSTRMNLSHEFDQIGLTVTGEMSLNQQERRMPPAGMWAIMTSMYRVTTMTPVFNEAGNPTGGQESPYLMIDPTGGYERYTDKFSNSRLTLDWEVPNVDGLSLQLTGNHKIYDQLQKKWYANSRGVGQSWNALNEKDNMGPPHLDQNYNQLI